MFQKVVFEQRVICSQYEFGKLKEKEKTFSRARWLLDSILYGDMLQTPESDKTSIKLAETEDNQT